MVWLGTFAIDPLWTFRSSFIQPPNPFHLGTINHIDKNNNNNNNNPSINTSNNTL